MDPESFDQIVARIAAAPSRRQALKGMGLGVLSALGGTAAGLALDADADAKGKGKGRNNKNNGGGKNKGNGGNGGDKNKGGGGNNGGDKNKNKNKGNGGNGGGDKHKGGNDDVALERKKGKNGKCRKNSNCLSNNCQGGKQKKKEGRGRCQASEVGERCRDDSDCIASSPCVGGICSFLS